MEFSDTSSVSCSSDSQSTPEEERIRRLFRCCDCNGDGYIDSEDLITVCDQLTLKEHSIEELLDQLGADHNGRVSFKAFLSRRMLLVNEISTLSYLSEPSCTTTTCSSTGVASGSSRENSVVVPSGGSNKNLNLNMTLESSRNSKEICQSGNCVEQKMETLEKSHEKQLEQLTQHYEAQLTELHCVVGELTRKLELLQNKVVVEEDELSAKSESLSRYTSNENLITEPLSEKEEPSTTSKCDVDQDSSSGLGDNDSVTDHRQAATDNGSCTKMVSKEVDDGKKCLETENLFLTREVENLESELFRLRISMQKLRVEHNTLLQQTKSSSLFAPSSLTKEANDVPIAKLAERVKIPLTSSSNPEESAPGKPRPKTGEWAEHSIEAGLNDHTEHGFSAEHRLQAGTELRLEAERYRAKAEHLAAQNDVIAIALEESRSRCDALSELMARYESNACAQRMALQCAERAIEAWSALMHLADADKALVLANCKAAAFAVDGEFHDIRALLNRARESRHLAESGALRVLRTLEEAKGSEDYPRASSRSSSGISPWDENCAGSISSSSSSGCCEMGVDSTATGWSRGDEAKLKALANSFKSDFANIQATIVSLEEVSAEIPQETTALEFDGRKVDLEYAVLLQELTAIKEERAELKAKVFLLEKEKMSLQLQLDSWCSQEQVYNIALEQANAKFQQILNESKSGLETSDEYGVKRIMDAIEQTRGLRSDRLEQALTICADLKAANDALVNALDKAKRHHDLKMVHFERQMTALVERHDAQVLLLQERIATLEGASIGNVNT